jgi:hypothetical protein
MRKLFIAFSALAAVGIALPVMTGSAKADESKVIVKKGEHHHHWRDHHHVKKIIIKKRGHDHDHD